MLNTKIKKLLWLIALCSLSLASSAESQSKPVQTLTLSKGQVLTMILPVVKPGDKAKSVMQEYASRAFPLAQQHGLKTLFNLKVKQAIISNIEPSVFAFYSWTDKVSEQAFLSTPQWPEIRAMRPNAWQHLDVYNTELQQDIDIEFSPEYHYTAVIAWFDDEKPADYQQYLENIEPALEAVGGKFLLKLQNPVMETHSNTFGEPGQITFVRWTDEDGFKRLQKHPIYQKHKHLFGTGLKHFEFYGLGVR